MIEIVLCTDDNYVMPTAVLMTSIAASNPDEQIHYNIISAGLSQAAQDTLSRNLVNPSFGISFYTIDESYLKDCPIRRGEHVSIATYFRLLLPTILPKEIGKVLDVTESRVSQLHTKAITRLRARLTNSRRGII